MASLFKLRHSAEISGAVADPWQIDRAFRSGARQRSPSEGRDSGSRAGQRQLCVRDAIAGKHCFEERGNPDEQFTG
jgi:hypothetical protein